MPAVAMKKENVIITVAHSSDHSATRGAFCLKCHAASPFHSASCPLNAVQLLEMEGTSFEYGNSTYEI